MGKDRTKLIKIVHPNSKIKLQKRTNLPQDRLSELPDEILVCILSSLSNLKERQRTSVLSKRWRYLFRNLVFNNSILVTLRKKYNFGEISKDRYIMTVSSERSKFISRVNRALLKLNPDDIIDQFKVEFSLNATYTSVIDNWISHLLRKKVKMLSLHLGTLWGTKYTLTTQLLQSYSLKSLTDLSLASVDVTGEVLEYVLSNCPFIESLHVQDTRSLKNLKTSAPLPKLKHLEILYCDYFLQIEIHAINLVSFKYLENMAILKAVLGDVPNFVSQSVLGGYAGYLFDNNDCSISRSLSQLETLDISFILGNRFKRIPELRNLRQLKLGIYHFTNGHFNCTSFLKASPMLHTFGLKFLLYLFESYKVGKDRTKLIKIVHPTSKIKLQKRTNLPQDRLSELPDEILVCILSSLSNLKERQRTSVLSKRNSTMCPSCTSCGLRSRALLDFLPGGIKAVFVSYRDQVGKIQKFALQFSTIYETDVFINALKEILKDMKDIPSLNSDYGSEIVSQSEFLV